MKKLYIILTIIMFLLIIPDVKAAACNNSDIIRVKGIANDVKVSVVEVKNKIGILNLEITGLTDEIYIKEENTGYTYTPESRQEDGKIIMYNVASGNYTFKIYYFKCSNKLMRTFSVEVPKYNYFSKHKLCQNIDVEEIKECNEWYQGELTEEKLTKIIEDYNEEKEKKEQEENKFLNKVINFLLKNYLYIIGGIIVISIITIILIKNKKRGELE